jgi:hypothetical protein
MTVGSGLIRLLEASDAAGEAVDERRQLGVRRRAVDPPAPEET